MNDSFLPKAIEIVQEAGQMLIGAFGQTLKVDAMSDHDIKLKLDQECQELMTHRILEAFSDHTVFGEEGSTAEYGASELQWIVDPIDGTVNFFYGFPHFAITLALQKNRQTILGITYDPLRNELFTAVKGGGAKLNGHKIRVSARKQLNEAMVSTGFAKMKSVVEESWGSVQFLANHARKVRMNGCAALDLAYIACGRLDAYFERGIRLWDIAGGTLLVEEAGGRVDLLPRSDIFLSYLMTASNGQLVDLPNFFEKEK
ncbi:MAG: inositol monophosphatase [Verrucomicrobiae bacterium]|nr:inositol monophosphatase [Verrucomicrobiae bacterium]